MTHIDEPCTCLTPLCGWTPCDINVTYTLPKSAFNGLQFRPWQYRSISIRLAVIASKTREMSQNRKRNWPYSSSRSSPSDIDLIYTPLKSAFNGLQYCRWHYKSIFIRLAVVASQSQESTRNSEKIWPYTSSRPSKVIDLGVNRKPMYDFLLVTNSNFGRICYRVRDIDT